MAHSYIRYSEASADGLEFSLLLGIERFIPSWDTPRSSASITLIYPTEALGIRPLQCTLDQRKYWTKLKVIEFKP